VKVTAYFNPCVNVPLTFIDFASLYEDDIQH